MTVTGIDLARGPDRCVVWGGVGLLAEVSGVVEAADAMGLSRPLRRGVRLKLRLSFRDWSRAVDADGLASCRQWLTAVETILNAPTVHPEA